jgi:hypothetical protein
MSKFGPVQLPPLRVLDWFLLRVESSKLTGAVEYPK